MFEASCIQGAVQNVNFSCHSADVSECLHLCMRIAPSMRFASAHQVARRHPHGRLAQIPRQHCRVNPDFVEGYCRVIVGLQSAAAAKSALVTQIEEIMGGT